MKYISKIFCPQLVIPKGAKLKVSEITTKSQTLLNDLGFIRSTAPGCFAILPLGERVLRKLEHLVESCMLSVGSQKISLPSLCGTQIWNKTGRLNDMGTELFQLKDRQGKPMLLSPTHEESVTALIGMTMPISYKSLPLRLHQISTKYRDEMRPRFGLLRAREFTMCDMYSFDSTITDAEVTYNAVGSAYDALFDKLDLPYWKVSSDGGSMRGRVSHEWLLQSDIGENSVFLCKQCGHTESTEETEQLNVQSCPKCSNNNKETLTIGKGIEVAHTFLLGDWYSSRLQVKVSLSEKSVPIQMGSYGIGLSRLLAAACELISTENSLRWPSVLAPYTVCIIGPKEGSPEMNQCGHFVEKMNIDLTSALPHLREDILIDDRHSLTVGKRLLHISRLGVPYVITVGKHTVADNNKFELINVYESKSQVLTFEEIVSYLKNPPDYHSNSNKDIKQATS